MRHERSRTGESSGQGGGSGDAFIDGSKGNETERGNWKGYAGANELHRRRYAGRNGRR